METISSVDFLTLMIFSGITVLAFFGIMYGLGEIWAADQDSDDNA